MSDPNGYPRPSREAILLTSATAGRSDPISIDGRRIVDVFVSVTGATTGAKVNIDVLKPGMTASDTLPWQTIDSRTIATNGNAGVIKIEPNAMTTLSVNIPADDYEDGEFSVSVFLGVDS